MNKPSLDEIFKTKPTQKPSLDEIFKKPSVEDNEEVKKENVFGGVKTAGQIIGGITGGILTPKHPFAGAAVGGTIGRTTADIATKVAEPMGEELTKRPDIALAKSLGGAPFIEKDKDIVSVAKNMLPFGSYLSKEDLGELSKEAGKTAVIEAVMAPIGMSVSKVGGFLGTKITEGLIGARVSQRGVERGFSKILQDKFFKQRVPQKIAKGVGGFFNKLSNSTGKGVADAINKNNKSIVFTSMDDIVGKVLENTKYTGVYGYLDEITLKSGVEKKILKYEAERLVSLAGKKTTIKNVWEYRKVLDKLIRSRNWSDDGYDFINRLRKIYNAPLLNADEAIQVSFSKYQFVKEAEDDLAKKFAVTMGHLQGEPGQLTRETFGENVENFAKNILNTSNDDLIRRLKALDQLTNVDDRIIEEFLDYAAAESLERGVGMGLVQQIVASFFGGRVGVAKLNQIIRSPATQGLKTLMGRGLVTTIREGANQQ